MSAFKKYTGTALIALGVAGMVTSYALYRHEPKPPQALPHSVAAQAVPSAAKPTPQAIASYSVPPTLPKYISAPIIGITQAKIRKLGLMRDGQIAVPDNIYDAGWYEASSKPGDAGAMFLYGHVSSWEANGLFYNLKKLKARDIVTITRGDNTTYRYQVVSSKVYPHDKVDMTAVLSPIDANRPGLNLMTCAGHVIKGTSEFDERLVVFTSLVGS